MTSSAKTSLMDQNIIWLVDRFGPCCITVIIIMLYKFYKKRIIINYMIIALIVFSPCLTRASSLIAHPHSFAFVIVKPTTYIVHVEIKILAIFNWTHTKLRSLFLCQGKALSLYPWLWIFVRQLERFVALIKTPMCFTSSIFGIGICTILKLMIDITICM